VDREKVKSQGVDLQDLYDTMQIYLGSLYAKRLQPLSAAPIR